MNQSAIDVNDVDGAGVVTPGFMAEVVQILEERRVDYGISEEAAGNEKYQEEGNVPQVLVLRDYCLRPWGSSCTRCALLCPQQAIVLTENDAPSIVADRCNGCGICAGVCDGYVVSGTGLPELYRQMRSQALTSGEVFVTCDGCIDQELHDSYQVVVVPSLGLFSAEFLACLLSESTKLTIVGPIDMLFDERHGGVVAELLFAEAVDQAEAWSGKRIGYQEFLTAGENGLSNSQDGLASRREYFDQMLQFFSEYENVHESHKDIRLQEAVECRKRISQRQAVCGLEVPRINTFMPGSRLKQTLWPKRRLLLEAIMNLPEVGDRVSLQCSLTDSELCVDCLRCVNACPSKARFAHPEDGLLEFDGRYCIGCSLCVDMCPMQAIVMEFMTPSVQDE